MKINLARLIEEGASLCNHIQINRNFFQSIRKNGKVLVIKPKKRPVKSPEELLFEQNLEISEKANNWFLDVLELLKLEDPNSIIAIDFSTSFHSFAPEQSCTNDPDKIALLLYKEIEKANKVLIEYSKQLSNETPVVTMNNSKIKFGKTKHSNKTTWDGILKVVLDSPDGISLEVILELKPFYFSTPLESLKTVKEGIYKNTLSKQKISKDQIIIDNELIRIELI